MIRLFNWFRRASLESGFDRELQYHFDRRVAATVAAEPLVDREMTKIRA